MRGRGKGADEKLRQLEERARKAEEQLVIISSAQSQGRSTLAPQLAMREALEVRSIQPVHHHMAFCFFWVSPQSPPIDFVV